MCVCKLQELNSGATRGAVIGEEREEPEVTVFIFTCCLLLVRKLVNIDEMYMMYTKSKRSNVYSDPSYIAGVTYEK